MVHPRTLAAIFYNSGIRNSKTIHHYTTIDDLIKTIKMHQHCAELASILHSHEFEATILTIWLDKEDGTLNDEERAPNKRTKTQHEEETLTSDLSNIIQNEETAIETINTLQTLHIQSRHPTLHYIIMMNNICRAIEADSTREAYARSAATQYCHNIAMASAHHVAGFVGTTAGHSQLFCALLKHAEQHISGITEMMQECRF